MKKSNTEYGAKKKPLGRPPAAPKPFQVDAQFILSVSFTSITGEPVPGALTIIPLFAHDGVPGHTAYLLGMQSYRQGISTPLPELSAVDVRIEATFAVTESQLIHIPKDDAYKPCMVRQLIELSMNPDMTKEVPHDPHTVYLQDKLRLFFGLPMPVVAEDGTKQ